VISEMYHGKMDWDKLLLKEYTTSSEISWNHAHTESLQAISILPLFLGITV
jgi:hypothetical protein